MKRKRLILAALPLFILTGCGEKTTELSKEEAKVQLNSMIAEISKDTFTTPTSGMQTSIITATGKNATTESYYEELRFNTVLGSRYIFHKTIGVNNSDEACIYEKDGKYYSYSSSNNHGSLEEYSTETEFLKSFYFKVSQYSIDSDSLKETATTFLNWITVIYDSFAEPSVHETTYDFKFIKINNSSFKFCANEVSKDNKENETPNSSMTMEFESYLLKSRKEETNGIFNDQKINLTIDQTCVWNNVDYIYPNVK